MIGTCLANERQSFGRLTEDDLEHGDYALRVLVMMFESRAVSLND